MINRYTVTNPGAGQKLLVLAPGVQLWIEQSPDDTFANRNGITFGEDGGFGLPVIQRSMYKRCTPWPYVYVHGWGAAPTSDDLVLIVSDDPEEDIVMSPGILII